MNIYENRLEATAPVTAKRLNQGIFDGLSSKWQWAIVDESGNLFLTEVKPELVGRYLTKKWGVADGAIYHMDKGYDTSIWNKEILKRIK